MYKRPNTANPDLIKKSPNLGKQTFLQGEVYFRDQYITFQKLCTHFSYSFILLLFNIG